MKETAAKIAFAVSLLLVPMSILADGPFEKEIKARKSVMQLYAFNLGLLGDMAKGEREYDATLAAAAANNLNAAAMMDNGAMWPQGSDADNADLKVETRAKPEIWSTYPEVADKGKDMGQATAVLAAMAGTGLEGMKKSVAAVGKSCKGCHEDFRIPKD